MPTPPVTSACTISHFTAGTRQPYSIDARGDPAHLAPAGARRARRVKPMSCISRNATTNITARTAARRTNGAPRLTSCASTPPPSEPVSIATPPTICPRPKTSSSAPSKPVASSASTSHASTAPEKNVKPSPSAERRERPRPERRLDLPQPARTAASRRSASPSRAGTTRAGRRCRRRSPSAPRRAPSPR